MTGFIELITSAQVLVGFVIVAAIVALSGYSLWHALTTPEQAFVVEGKRSRVFWAALNALALGVSFLALTPTGPVGIFGALMMLIIPGGVLVPEKTRQRRLPAATPHTLVRTSKRATLQQKKR